MFLHRIQNLKRYYIQFWVIYLGIMLVSTFLSELPVFAMALKPLYFLFIIVGIVLFIYRQYISRRMEARSAHQTMSNSKLLYLFLVINLISVALNYNYNTSKNLMSLAYMFIIITLVYDFDYFKEKELIGESLYKIAYLIVSMSLICSILSLLTFVFGISYKDPSGYTIGIDTSNKRLWGIYNPNAGSMLSIISIALSLLLIHKTNRKKIKTLCIINISSQYLYFILAQSRTNILAFSAFLIIVVSALIFNRLSDFELIYESRSKFKKFTFAIILAFAINVAFLGVSQALRYRLNYIPSMTRNINLEDNEEYHEKDMRFYIEDSNLKNFDIKRSHTKDSEKDFSGRKDYWLLVSEEVEEKPLFGYSHEGILTEVISGVEGAHKSYVTYGDVHNIFFTILGSAGSLGLLVYLLFLIRQNVQILDYIANDVHDNNRFDLSLVIVYALVAAIYIAELMESRTFYSLNFYALIAWLNTGILESKTKAAAVKANELSYEEKRKAYAAYYYY